MAREVRTVRSLGFRIPATAIVVFAASLAVATLLAYQLLVQAGRADVDAVLDREAARFRQSMQRLLEEELAAAARPDPTEGTDGADGTDGEAQTPADDPPDLVAAVTSAATRYLALNPSTESYWTLIHLDGRALPLASSNAPAVLQDLYDRGELPPGTVGQRETLPTDVGDIRSLTSPILVAGTPVGSFQIVAPLAPIRSHALTSAGLVAAAAGVSLILGAALLATTLRRSLTPLQELARTARSTELRSLASRVEEPETEDEVGVLAREFNSMLARIEAASASRTEFLATVSHELRTPVTIARGHLEILRATTRDEVLRATTRDEILRATTQEDPDALRETIAVVEDELQRMGRLVEDLMAIARSETDDFVRPRDVELVAFFEDLEVRIGGLRLPGVRIEPPPPVTLHADPDRLAQALLNLVTNADRHTPTGTRILVRARADDGGEVVLEVADDGPGIPEAIRDDVFAPFVHAGDVGSSTGLGLAVVDAVVRAHDGHVQLDTGPAGTRIALHLPPPSSTDVTSELVREPDPDLTDPVLRDRHA